MSNYKKSFSENSFQDKFVNELVKYSWLAPDYLDGSKGGRVTVDDLTKHWRKELNRINADQLEGVELTDNEFLQVMNKVNQISNSYEAAKLLAMEESTGKIDGIYRDNNPNITREQITLTIFKKAEVRGGDSSYKVAREVTSANGNRFDVVLLINGLPLIVIEQKRADKSLDEAFFQFKRYYKDGEYIHNFMAFAQMMVIMSEVAMRYFATPKTIDSFNKSFIFQWADENNNPINDWKVLVEKFFKIPMAHQLVGDYLIIDENKDKEKRKHMIMRPYQVYALQAVEGAAFGWGNDGIPHGGYVWHTTGSGKTITSFKTALFLSTRGGFDKVIFLVDRRELDKDTSEKFSAYAKYENVSVDGTKYTHNLKKEIEADGRGIIVTTTFKLSNLVKILIENEDYNLTDKRIVFIIDEAHRTTMGEMMVGIRRFFKKKGLFYGFTGTPLFDENESTGMINEKSEVIDTTEKLFGKELHKYTIDQAIADGNVLGFHVEYINTGEFVSYQDLRNKIIEEKLVENPNISKKEVQRLVSSWSDLEVEKEAVNKSLLVYQDETHIPIVVKEIIENWDLQSQNKHFNAILTVAYRDRVVEFYKEFQKQLENSDVRINVAMTFSFETSSEIKEIPAEVVDSMFKDYAEFTGIQFKQGDTKRGEEAYFDDLLKRSTNGGSGRNAKNIDLIIVADQLLTGYDNVYLNTLYVDRKLHKQGLIQAYSRTNRIYGSSKEFGTVVNFKYPLITEELVNTALKLYGSGGKSSMAIVSHYSTVVEKFNEAVIEMISNLNNPSDWQLIINDKEQKEFFVKSFKETNSLLRLLNQYYEYKWIDVDFGIDYHTWLKYVGAYQNLINDDVEEREPEEINEIYGITGIITTQEISASHILNLIDKKVTLVEGVKTLDQETIRIIYEQIQELSDSGDHREAMLLKEFVEEELAEKNLTSTLNFDELYEEWKKSRLDKEVASFAKEWGIDEEILNKSIKRLYYVKEDQIPYLDEISDNIDFSVAENKESENHLEHFMKVVSRELPEWIAKIKKTYD